jgi:TATA-binding protein-associated factor
VVNQQNAGLGTMQTDQILDLFNVGDAERGGLSFEDKANDPNAINESDAVDAEGNVREKGKKGILDELTELWDERQYEEEFNLDGFLATMKA